MADILSFVLVAFIVALGAIPSVYIIISMIYMFGYKIRNKVKYGKSLYD